MQFLEGFAKTFNFLILNVHFLSPINDFHLIWKKWFPFGLILNFLGNQKKSICEEKPSKSAENVHLVLLCLLGDAIRCTVSADCDHSARSFRLSASATQFSIGECWAQWATKINEREQKIGLNLMLRSKWDCDWSYESWDTNLKISLNKDLDFILGICWQEIVVFK